MSYIVHSGSSINVQSGSVTVSNLLYITGSLILTGSTNISPISSITAAIAGTNIGTESKFNFFTGSGLLITGSDDGSNNRVNLLINTGSSVATLLSGLVPTNELGTTTADSTKFLRGDQVWAVPSTSGVANVRYASTFATSGNGTSGSPWKGWDTGSGVFNNLPAVTSNPITIVFEPGWFQANSGTVNISHSSITVAGFGPQSIIKFPDYGDGFAWYGNSAGSGSGGAGYTQVVINGLHLIGSNLADGGVIGGTESHQIGLRLERVYDFWVSGCFIELFGTAGDPEAEDEQGDGICCIAACKRGHIIGNRLERNKISGIFIAGSNGNLTTDTNWAEDIEVIGNVSDRNHHTGIHTLDNSRNITISGNTCNYNEGRGILLEDVGENATQPMASCPRYSVVSNNICFRNTGSTAAPPIHPAQGGCGIETIGGQDFIITGNICRENFGNTGSSGFEQGAGIKLLGGFGVVYNTDPSRIIISNNLIESNIGDGIVFDTSPTNTGSQIQILNNYIKDNGVSGGFGVEVVNAGTIAFSGSKIVGNTFENNSSGMISLPAGLVNVIIDDNKGYNPAPSAALNFITRVVTTKAGKPVDSDFVNPQDGQVVIDTSGLREYVRIGGNWHTGSAII